MHWLRQQLKELQSSFVCPTVCDFSTCFHEYPCVFHQTRLVKPLQSLLYLPTVCLSNSEPVCILHLSFSALSLLPLNQTEPKILRLVGDSSNETFQMFQAAADETEVVFLLRLCPVPGPHGAGQLLRSPPVSAGGWGSPGLWGRSGQ